MNITLLLVEDDALARVSEAFGLRRAGYKVMTAGSLLEASRWSLQTRPDLVLVDIGMPDGEGTVVARWLQAANVPFIFVTARSRAGDVRHGLEMGALDYIVKPVGLDELVARVGAVARRVGLVGNT